MEGRVVAGTLVIGQASSAPRPWECRRVDPPTVRSTGLDLELVKRALIAPVRSPQIGCLGNVNDPWSVPASGIFRVSFMSFGSSPMGLYSWGQPFQP